MIGSGSVRTTSRIESDRRRTAFVRWIIVLLGRQDLPSILSFMILYPQDATSISISIPFSTIYLSKLSKGRRTQPRIYIHIHIFEEKRGGGLALLSCDLSSRTTNPAIPHIYVGGPKGRFLTKIRSPRKIPKGHRKQQQQQQQPYSI